MWLAVTSCSDSVHATWLRSHLYGEKLSRLKGLLPTQASLGEPTSLSFPYKTCRTVHMRNKGCLELEESTWPRHYNQSMRKRPWLRQRSQLFSQKDPRLRWICCEGDLLSRDDFSPYKRSLSNWCLSWPGAFKLFKAWPLTSVHQAL